MFLILILILIAIIIISKFVFKVNIKKSKALALNNEALDKLTRNLPNNKEVCQSILKDLNNTTTKIEESQDEKSSTSLYMVAPDKILIADLKQSFVRFQTIAHECIHSIQNKKLQILHYILANIYILGYFAIIICNLVMNNKLEIVFAIFMTLVGIPFLVLKFILEKDAIVRSKGVAINYLKKTNKLQAEDINKIEAVYTEINEQGINFNKFNGVLNFCSRIIIYLIICEAFIR